jgi:hypothetical protein
LRAGAREFETELGEGRGFAFGDVGLAFGDGDGHRHEQRLRAQAGTVVRALQLLVTDAFVRGVHVHDDQAFGVLGEDVDAVQLRDGEAEWRRCVVAVSAWASAQGLGERDMPPARIQRRVTPRAFLRRARQARLRIALPCRRRPSTWRDGASPRSASIRGRAGARLRQRLLQRAIR